MEIEYLFAKNNQKINGPLILKPTKFNDQRGYFYESWNKKTFLEILEKNQVDDVDQKKLSFVQDNQSFSAENVLRGLHFQIKPYAQGKLVSCVKGEIYDVAVDLRRDSETFTKWGGLFLSEENCKQLWIPEGFAHGFISTSNEARVSYKTTAYWNKDSERTILWNDSTIEINWPLIKKEPIISDKDNQGLFLKDLDAQELF